MYVRSIIKKCPICGDIAIMRLDETKEEKYLTGELAEYLPDNLKLWYSTGVCTHCSKTNSADLLYVGGTECLDEEMHKSDEEATRFLMSMLSVCNGNESDVAGTLLALNLLDMEDICYVDDTYTIRPRCPKETVEGYSHILMNPETDKQSFMLLTEEEYESYFNVFFKYTEEYDKLPLKVQAYVTFGIVSEDVANRVREVNEVNYNKYRELIIRSLGGIILRQMFEEGVTQ